SLVDNQVPHLSATAPGNFGFRISDLKNSLRGRDTSEISHDEHKPNPKSEIRNSKFCWVGRRELDPHRPQSQCGALPLSYDPHTIANCRLRNADWRGWVVESG